MRSPGELDQVVTLLKPTTTKDRFGQHVTYGVIANVAAKVSPLSGREYFAAAATQNAASLRIEIWWRIDVDATWRVDWMGKHYQLVTEPIDTDGKHQALELMCSSVPK